MSGDLRTLADGSGGIMYDSRTGETTSHFKPCTGQQRLVTPWEEVAQQEEQT